MSYLTKRSPFPTIYSERCHNDDCARMADWHKRFAQLRDEIEVEQKNGIYPAGVLQDMHNGLTDMMTEARGTVMQMEEDKGRDGSGWFE